MIELEVNGARHRAAVAPETPLLYVLRNALGLVGTRFGCGSGQCGACMVLVDGRAMASCDLPVSFVTDKKVTTIEGLGNNAVQKAWVAIDVPQCGYCQPGQIMSATALLASNKNPSDADIDAFMSGNLCRCGTYPRIRAAIKQAAKG